MRSLRRRNGCTANQARRWDTGMTPGEGTSLPSKPRDARPGHPTRRARARAMASVTMAEREAERLSARVEQLEREKAALEAFAGIAAHELVEPLVITEAYATMIAARLDGDEHEDSLRDLDALTRTVARTRLLLEALLNDARTSDTH